jgi:hypothetical protein
MSKKICRCCGEEKPLAEFYRQKVNADGYLHQCKSCRNVVIKKWRLKNIDFAAKAQKETSRRHYILNKEKRCIQVDNYSQKNKHKVNARAAKRRAMQLRLTPSWADKQEIEMWYELAAVLSKSGVAFEVDHIVPLQGKLAWGFHSQDNLQVLPAHLNRSKGATL